MKREGKKTNIGCAGEQVINCGQLWHLEIGVEPALELRANPGAFIPPSAL